MLAAQSTRPTTRTILPSPPSRQTGVSARSAAATQTSKSRPFSPNPPKPTTPQDALEHLLARSQRDGLQEPRHLRCGPPTDETDGHGPEPTNAQYYVPITAPNTSAVGAGGGPVFIASGLDTNFTVASAPAPVNLTAQNETVPWAGPRVAASSTNSSGSSGNKNGAVGAREGIVGANLLGALLAGLAALLLA